MPQLGESVTEGTIARWLKGEGDEVEKDEPLCEVDTDKVSAELPSPFAGKIEKLLISEGTTVDRDRAGSGRRGPGRRARNRRSPGERERRG
jgi:pyruvate/2-oxoglutarate dehydrogenase complex dihydrolipoamide acyltransferase (E2) component